MSENTVRPCINMNLDINIVNDEITVFNRETKKSYIIGSAEYDVLVQMDGSKTISELSEISKRYSQEQITRLLEAFRTMGFLEGSKPKVKKDLFKIKLGVINGNKLFEPNSLITRLLELLIVYLSLPLFVFSLRRYFIASNGFQDLNISQLQEVPYIFHILCFICIATIHEFAHAVVARRLNVAVPEIGVMLYIIVPLVYTNLSFIKLLKKKSERLLCLIAGILSNILLAGISLFLAYYIKGDFRLILEEIALMNMILVLTNLMIFFKLDGYFIFQELLEESYLREKSFAMVQENILKIFNKLRRKNSNDIKGSYKVQLIEEENRLFYYLYGILSICYIPVLLVSFTINIIQNIW